MSVARANNLALATVADCASWCASNVLDWNEKCTWPKCGGCSECAGELFGTRHDLSLSADNAGFVTFAECRRFCYLKDRSWPNKCTWSTCSGCSECSGGFRCSVVNASSLLMRHTHTHIKSRSCIPVPITLTSSHIRIPLRGLASPNCCGQ